MQNPHQQPKSGLSKTIRYFFIASIPILLIVYIQPELDLPEVPLQVVVGNFFWIGFLLLIAWKYYWEMWRPRQKKKAALKENEDDQDQNTSIDR